MSIDLDKLVLQQLDARRGDWQAVAAASGVSYSWLSKFANGHIPNPGFETLKKLHENLTATQPAVSGSKPTDGLKLVSPQAPRIPAKAT